MKKITNRKTIQLYDTITKLFVALKKITQFPNFVVKFQFSSNFVMLLLRIEILKKFAQPNNSKDRNLRN